MKKKGKKKEDSVPACTVICPIVSKNGLDKWAPAADDYWAGGGHRKGVGVGSSWKAQWSRSGLQAPNHPPHDPMWRPGPFQKRQRSPIEVDEKAVESRIPGRRS